MSKLTRDGDEAKALSHQFAISRCALGAAERANGQIVPAHPTPSLALHAQRTRRDVEAHCHQNPPAPHLSEIGLR
jgi:hypothetical protein